MAFSMTIHCDECGFELTHQGSSTIKLVDEWHQSGGAISVFTGSAVCPDCFTNIVSKHPSALDKR